MTPGTDGWGEYSQFVLRELERLATAQEKIYLVLREAEVEQRELKAEVATTREALRLELQAARFQFDIKSKFSVAVVGAVGGIIAALAARLV
jgi:hypothetical protein